jgi:hypothetical protein
MKIKITVHAKAKINKLVVSSLETNAYRYATNTKWHFNDGSPNIYGYGAK